MDPIVRLGVTQAYAYVRGISIEHARGILARTYARYDDDSTRALCDWATRGETAPAMTYVPDWAGFLVGTRVADAIDAHLPQSAFGQLAAAGLQLPFGRAGRIAVPNFDPNVAGGFVREGEPIPMMGGDTSGQYLTMKKMAVIVAFTKEIDEASIPAIEALLRARIRESTSIVMDRVLLDDQPATDTRPAGLLHGGEELVSTGGLQGDIQALTGGVSERTSSHMRMPVLIMNTIQAFAARMYGDKDIPILTSPGVPDGTVIALDAADFVAAGGEPPRFEIGEQAMVHMDTNPRPIGAGSPIRSLWQTATLSLRMVLYVDWCLRRPGALSFMRNVFWHSGGSGGGSNPRARPRLAAPLITPPVGNTVTVQVDERGSVQVGNKVWISPIGYFEVMSIED